MISCRCNKATLATIVKISLRKKEGVELDLDAKKGVITLILIINRMKKLNLSQSWATTVRVMFSYNYFLHMDHALL
jgi:hypothetical protein